MILQIESDLKEGSTGRLLIVSVLKYFSKYTFFSKFCNLLHWDLEKTLIFLFKDSPQICATSDQQRVSKCSLLNFPLYCPTST